MRCTACSCTTSATSGRSSCPPSPNGTSSSIGIICRNRHERRNAQEKNHVWNCRTHPPEEDRRYRNRDDEDAEVAEASRSRLYRLRPLRQTQGQRARAALQGGGAGGHGQGFRHPPADEGPPHGSGSPLEGAWRQDLKGGGGDG